MSLVAGREQVLTCESRGGNPAPVLSWWLGDQQLDSEQVGAPPVNGGEFSLAGSARKH